MILYYSTEKQCYFSFYSSSSFMSFRKALKFIFSYTFCTFLAKCITRLYFIFIGNVNGAISSTFPFNCYCLSTWRYWFLYVTLYIATILKLLLLLVIHSCYWHLYLHFYYVITVTIHFKAQIVYLWLLCSFDNHKCFYGFLAFGQYKSSSVILEQSHLRPQL